MGRNFFRTSNERLSVDVGIVTAAPFTMACWARTANVSQNQSIMFLGDKDVSNHWWVLRLNGSAGADPLRFARKDGGTTNSINTTTDFAADTWHHCAAVEASATDAAVFLDGGSKATSTTSIVPAGVDRFTIGRSDDSTPANNHDGDVAEAGLWDVALTDAEILSLAGGVAPIRVRPGNLVGYWPLYSALGDAPDYSKNSNTLTDNQTVRVADHAPVAPFWGLGVGWQGAFTVAAAAATSLAYDYRAAMKPILVR